MPRGIPKAKIEKIREATDDREDYITVDPATGAKSLTKLGMIAGGVIAVLVVVAIIIFL